MDDRLYRSRYDRVIAGVAGGVAERLDADPSIIRIVWAILIFLTGGLALVVYIVMAVVVPERPADVPAGTPGSPTAEGPAPWGSTPGASDAAARPVRREDRTDRTRIGLIGGLALIGIGAIFLVRELVPAFDLDLLWPVMLIALGVVLLVVAVVPSRPSS
ncbi:MAG TPA: PspC domain-containing protein [Candidatus Limnocylindrales bacterium]